MIKMIVRTIILKNRETYKPLAIWIRGIPMYSVLFHAAEESASLAGAKGLNLIKLNNHGLPVPDGFIIKTNSFASFLSYHNLQPAEQNLSQKSKKHRFLYKWKQSCFRPFNPCGRLTPQLQSGPLLLLKISKAPHLQDSTRLI